MSEVSDKAESNLHRGKSKDLKVNPYFTKKYDKNVPTGSSISKNSVSVSHYTEEEQDEVYELSNPIPLPTP